MIQFKEKIADAISNATQIEKQEIEGYIEIPKDDKNGDYAFPCFRLAKTMKKAPQAIAEEIKEKISIDDKIIGNMSQLPVTVEGTICIIPNELYEGFFITKIKKK